MDILIGIVIGVVIGTAITFFVARNNQKKFNEAFDINPKAKLNEVIRDLKDRLSKR